LVTKKLAIYITVLFICSASFWHVALLSDLGVLSALMIGGVCGELLCSFISRRSVTVYGFIIGALVVFMMLIAYCIDVANAAIAS
jgi:hypothetical protein